MKGASFSVLVKEIGTERTLYTYDTDRELIPASVMKLVTSSAALEVLGEDFRFETTLEYDGEIKDGILAGNLYIKGSGDPTLGSSHMVPEGTRDVFYVQQQFLRNWIQAIKNAGIREIEGSVIADDSLFDTEVIPMKWLREDMGSYYGAGSYSISVFDNQYRLILKTGESGSRPEITECIPEIPGIVFHNYLATASVSADSSYIVGYPYSNDRYLYGVVPARKEKHTVRGDIPDPGIFLAGLLHSSLIKENIRIQGDITSYRLLAEANQWAAKPRKQITSTYSPPLAEIIEIINKKSHNLYTDAILKILGFSHEEKKDEILSSFGKGTTFVKDYWKEQGLDVTSLWMFDGSGVAPTDKVSTGLICDLLLYMHQSPHKDTFFASLPKVGEEGSVRNFLKGSVLQGKARLKSGGMSRVRSYAGYVQKEDKEYVVAIIVNNYHGEGRNIIQKMEKLLISLFQ